MGEERAVRAEEGKTEDSVGHTPQGDAGVNKRRMSLPIQGADKTKGKQIRDLTVSEPGHSPSLQCLALGCVTTIRDV